MHIRLKNRLLLFWLFLVLCTCYNFQALQHILSNKRGAQLYADLKCKPEYASAQQSVLSLRRPDFESRSDQHLQLRSALCREREAFQIHWPVGISVNNILLFYYILFNSFSIPQMLTRAFNKRNQNLLIKISGSLNFSTQPTHAAGFNKIIIKVKCKLSWCYPIRLIKLLYLNQRGGRYGHKGNYTYNPAPPTYNKYNARQQRAITI